MCEAQRPRNPLPLEKLSRYSMQAQEIKTKAEKEKEREREVENLEARATEEARKEKDETSIEVFFRYVQISTDKNRRGCFCRERP